jgi:hypothetical protein
MGDWVPAAQLMRLVAADDDTGAQKFLEQTRSAVGESDGIPFSERVVRRHVSRGLKRLRALMKEQA